MSVTTRVLLPATLSAVIAALAAAVTAGVAASPASAMGDERWDVLTLDRPAGPKGAVNKPATTGSKAKKKRGKKSKN